MRTNSVWLALAVAGCPGADDESAQAEETATLAVKDYVGQGLDELHAASVALCAAAPDADADGWNATDDAAAAQTMRGHWRDARVAYETIEGAIAVLFPDLDAATDERYDGFIAEAEDPNLFDAEGVTGVHGIERILFSDQVPAEVTAFESGLPGYVAPAFPADATQAEDFKTGLCARLVTDVAAMRDQFAPLALDPAAAYSGVLGSMAEQLEKIDLAASGEDESRYAQHTLADMRANLAGGEAVFQAFVPWLEAEDEGARVDAVQARFAAVHAAYDALEGDALPPVPATWDAAAPSDADLDTEYGRLWQVLSQEADPARVGSLVSEMLGAADALGLPVVL